MSLEDFAAAIFLKQSGNDLAILFAEDHLLEKTPRCSNLDKETAAFFIPRKILGA